MTGDRTDKERALSEIRSDIESTRQRLAQTLDEIEERLDVPKRVSKLVKEYRGRFDTAREENPAAVYGAIAGAAAVVIGAGVLIVRGARR